MYLIIDFDIVKISVLHDVNFIIPQLKKKTLTTNKILKMTQKFYF